MDKEMIQSRVNAREQARVLADLVLEEVATAPPEGQEAFWEQLWELLPLPERAVAELVVEPMTDKQSKEFGRLPIPFGKYKGEPVDQVPLDQLQWYADLPFQQQLRLYLASPRIQAEDRDREVEPTTRRERERI